ncbi:MAG: glucose 1-dehydrogenase [Chloroflexi bacterium]|nr:glucose 1-dehydrogenase [Chloroflexota bacterium]
MPGKMNGKRVLVTGSGTGIGREVALEFARQGAGVALHYANSKAGAESAVAEIRAAGGQADLLQADLGQVEECFRLVDFAAGFLGGLDVLVNNAGITEVWDFLDVTPAQFDQLYHVNIRGQFFCAQQAVRHMLKQEGGVIINMTSVHAFAGMAGHSVYAGTKGAIMAWTRELGIELARQNIRVNAVAPGWIEVPSHRAKYADYDVEAGGRQIPLGRVGAPIDVAKVCAFLASEDAAFIVGHTLLVDGGTIALMSLAELETQA